MADIPTAASEPASAATSEGATRTPLAHTFVYDATLAGHLAQAAVQWHHLEKRDLAMVAKDNYKLVRQGKYTDVHGVQHSIALSKSAINVTYSLPSTVGRRLATHPMTRVALARLDTASALRCMHSLPTTTGRVCALNFANQHHPGGGYLNGARAQEEDLCRLMPPLFSSLKRLRYPLRDCEAHYTQTLLARTAGSYAFDGPPLPVFIVSAAMPNLGGVGSKMAAGSPEWWQTVRTRLRAVLHAAREEQCETLILGAFGCGAFANPPDLVARACAEVLKSEEFRGCFGTIVFAILEARAQDGGNVAAFEGALRGLCAQTAPAEAHHIL